MSTSNKKPDSWSVKKSAEKYLIEGWGHPYFQIGKKGHVQVCPNPSRGLKIDLFELTQDLTERGLDLPLLIRFPDILQDRIKLINQCFEKAIEEYKYKGSYRGVYPIKVNQQRHLVEEVVQSGKPWRFGLEAGSKPELLIALAAMQDEDGFIVCNGYKDRTYLETALVAQRFDNTVVVVLERVEELPVVFEAYEKLNIRPCLGIRAKLSSKGTGRWADSAGERAKFGLTSAEIVQVIDQLAERNMLDCLQLLHFHLGSQVSSIIPVKNAMREVANLYVELCKMGCDMKFLDVGGGLAVDYDGSKTDFHASMNYDIQEYAYDVVAGIHEACDKASVRQPTIVSESGRAIASYQSVLIFNVLGADEVCFGAPKEPTTDSHRVVLELYETYHSICPKNIQESWHDASQAKEEAQSLFKFGYLGLRELAQAERLFWHCSEKIHQCAQQLESIPEELQDLDGHLSSIYYCNFSIFQSVPDMWAIEQMFPIMPIHRLDEEPSAKARLADLTCDSDGMVEHFIGAEKINHLLDVHPIEQDKPYLLGLFLGGAYQEILGDLHNLFGDTNAVHVHVEDYGYSVSNVIKGDAIDEVLRYLQYDPEDMVERVRKQAERALNNKRMTRSQMRTFMNHYEESLRGYTYLK